MRHFFAILLMAFVSFAHSEEPQKRWSFLLPGDYHEDEAPTNPGSGWLALVAVDGLWHLVPTEVSADRIDDVVLGSEGQRTGVQISTERPGAMALFRILNLRAGIVDTPNMRFGGNPRNLTPTKPLKIEFKGELHQLKVARSGSYLRKGLRRTRLPAIAVGGPESDDSAYLLWAGDLDSDGALDLLVGYSGYNSGGACLFLSSAAPKGALVGTAGCHGGVGC